MDTTKTIMVVDDEKPIRMLLQRILEEEGYHVLPAENGSSALTLLEDYSPDLILLDYIMPVINGFEVLKRLRKKSDIPVLMLTAIKEPEISEIAFNFGVDDFLTKPFSTKELLARIRAKLRRYPKKPLSECD